EANHFHRGHDSGYQLGHFDFALGGRAKAGPALDDFAKRLGHAWRAMSEDQRSPRADVIDIGVAVGIIDSGAVAAHNEQRCAADAAESSNGRVHTTWDTFLCAAKERLRDEMARHSRYRLTLDRSGITRFRKKFINTS